MTTGNRIAAVSGGTGGLGTAICRRLCAAGFDVVALHTPGNDRVPAWLAEQEQAGCRIDAVAADVASHASCAAAAAVIHDRHGPVSVLVNNAGVTRDASFRKMTWEQWDTVLRTNLDSMFNMTKPLVEDMIALGWGRIVNIASVNGQRGAFGQTNYAASKAGIHGFTKSLALELARKNTTVNTVSPGYLRTKMVEKVAPQVLQQQILPDIPLARLGEPDEVAQLIAYLVTDGAGFVTGADLSINGGQHMA
jgi:acetoacetyl-CoA reductase